MTLRVASLSLALLLCTQTALIWGVEDEKFVKPGPAPTRGTTMEYGPILSCAVELNSPAASTGQGAKPVPQLLATKGIVIRLGEKNEASVCFDTDLLRMAVGWTGGFLDLKDANIGSYKGINRGAGAVVGTVQFQTPVLPGWSADGTFSDPRPEKSGPLPKNVGHYRGLYLSGNRAVVAYEVGGTQVLESPDLKYAETQPVFIRHFRVGSSPAAISLLLDGPLESDAKAEGSDIHSASPNAAQLSAAPTAGEITITKGEQARVFALVNAPTGATFQHTAAGLRLNLPPHTEAAAFDVLIWNGPAANKPAKLASLSQPGRLEDLCHGGPVRWPELEPMHGTVAAEDSAYVVDTIPVPEENPWKSWMRLSAFDFLPDGRAVVSTFNGDVWIVSGLDGKLDNVRWKRFAVGLFEPLGLKVRDGEIYVHGRDQITRLRDLNGDGEADFYECFNNDRASYANYHAFAFDLQTDRAGNFYYVIGGNQLGTVRPWHACVVKVSADGSKSEVIATGFRAPNGMAVGPHDEIVVSDNQGQWIPSSKINLIRPGGFYGHVADPRIDPKAVAPAEYDQPLCWIPMAMDNSSGGQVWAPDSGKWGPFGGHLLHTSYGTCSLFAVLSEAISPGQVSGAAGKAANEQTLPGMQGGVVKFPLRFASGIMRPRFNPADGQLYLCGLKGWQTSAARDGCFQRVRYTGQPVATPTALHVAKDTIQLTFPTAFAGGSADPQNFSLEQWSYKWWATYGSPDMSVSDPTQKRRDRLEVTAAELSADGRTLTLHVPDLKPAMETLLKGSLTGADGKETKIEVAHTIHQISEH